MSALCNPPILGNDALGDYGDPAFLARLTDAQLTDELGAQARHVRHLKRTGFDLAVPAMFEQEVEKGRRLRTAAGERPGFDTERAIREGLAK